MLEVKRIAFSRLPKMDTYILLKGVVDIVKSHNPSTLRLKESYELLVEQQIKSEVMTFPNNSHWLTKVLTPLHKKRLKYAALITTQLRSLEKADFEETRQWVADAKLGVRTFLTYLGQKRQNEVYDSIDSFFSYLAANPEVQEAFAKLGLQIYLDELQKTNNEHRKLYKRRALEIKERPRDDSRIVERETQKILRLFFDELESYQRVFSELDYAPLVSDLNEIMTKYSKLLKTRITINKRRAAKKAKAAKETASREETKDKATSEQ